MTCMWFPHPKWEARPHASRESDVQWERFEHRFFKLTMPLRQRFRLGQKSCFHLPYLTMPQAAIAFPLSGEAQLDRRGLPGRDRRADRRPQR